MNVNIDLDHNYLNNSNPSSKQQKKKKLNQMIPFFEEYLPITYQGINLPDKLMRHRNFALAAIFIQIASSIAGFSFYFVRRVFIFKES